MIKFIPTSNILSDYSHYKSPNEVFKRTIKDYGLFEISVVNGVLIAYLSNKNCKENVKINLSLDLRNISPKVLLDNLLLNKFSINLHYLTGRQLSVDIYPTMLGGGQGGSKNNLIDKSNNSKINALVIIHNQIKASCHLDSSEITQLFQYLDDNNKDVQSIALEAITTLIKSTGMVDLTSINKVINCLKSESATVNINALNAICEQAKTKFKFEPEIIQLITKRFIHEFAPLSKKVITTLVILAQFDNNLADDIIIQILTHFKDSEYFIKKFSLEAIIALLHFGIKISELYVEQITELITDAEHSDVKPEILNLIVMMVRCKIKVKSINVGPIISYMEMRGYDNIRCTLNHFKELLLSGVKLEQLTTAKITHFLCCDNDPNLNTCSHELKSCIFDFINELMKYDFEFGPLALKQIITCINDEDEDICLESRLTISKLLNAGIKFDESLINNILFYITNNNKSLTRYYALSIVREFLKLNIKMSPLMIEKSLSVINDPDWSIRYITISIISELIKSGISIEPTIICKIIELLTDNEPNVRNNAINTIDDFYRTGIKFNEFWVNKILETTSSVNLNNEEKILIKEIVDKNKLNL